MKSALLFFIVLFISIPAFAVSGSHAWMDTNGNPNFKTTQDPPPVMTFPPGVYHTQKVKLEVTSPGGTKRSFEATSNGGSAYYLDVEVWSQGLWSLAGFRSIACPSGIYTSYSTETVQMRTGESWLGGYKASETPKGRYDSTATYAQIANCNSRCAKSAGSQTIVPFPYYPTTKAYPPYGQIKRRWSSSPDNNNNCMDYRSVQFKEAWAPVDCYDSGW